MNLLFLRDRYTAGLVSGIIAGFPVFIFNLISKLLLGTMMYSEIAGIIIYGHLPQGIPETAFAILTQFIVYGAFGVGFVYLIPSITSQNLLLKGLTYGVSVWLITYGITLIIGLLGVQDLRVVPLDTAISNFFGAAFWGLIAAYILRRINHLSDINR